MSSRKNSKSLRQQSRDTFETMFGRIQQATNTRTQIELAAILNVRQSSISDAKRRGSVPPDWVLKLLEGHAVNPNWIKYGEEPMLLPEGKIASVPRDGRAPDATLELVVNELILRLSPEELKEDIRKTLCLKYFSLKPTDTLHDVVSRILPGDIAARLCEHIFHNLYPAHVAQEGSGDKKPVE